MTPLPSELKRRLVHLLPWQNGTQPPVVRVTPRDRNQRRCPAYAADHFEVQAYYTTTDPDSLDRLELAVWNLPGVYMTTQVRGRGQGRNELTNLDWPVAAGVNRRGFHDLRAQVIALTRG